MKKFVYISICMAMLLISAVQNGKCLECPDLVCTSLTIEDISTNTSTNYFANIRYNYTVKNMGNDTLFLKNAVIQNYISPDSNYSHSYVAGGAFIDHSSTSYLLPDSTYSSTFEANTSYSLITNPVLIVRCYLVNQTDCNTDNDLTYKRIDLPGIGCPDVICTSFAVTNITTTTYTDISYNFTIKNIGNGTLFLKDIVVQNYVSQDSAFGSSLSVAGGGFIAYNSDKYLLPDSVYSSSYSASTNKSIATYPFLVSDFYFSAPIECTSDKSLGIKRIKIEMPSSLNETLYWKPEISWKPISKAFSIFGNSYTISNNYKIYNTNGKVVTSGNIGYNESKVLPLAPGIYIIEVLSANKRLVKKIIIE